MMRLLKLLWVAAAAITLSSAVQADSLVVTGKTASEYLAEGYEVKASAGMGTAVVLQKGQTMVLCALYDGYGRPENPTTCKELKK